MGVSLPQLFTNPYPHVRRWADAGQINEDLVIVWRKTARIPVEMPIVLVHRVRYNKLFDKRTAIILIDSDYRCYA